ncbi:MAG TPA: hypothetical protein VMF62_10070 [Acetobacteraceae bacterium]|nr:hypothetical protein [Acetobacteraceae bacterium]
MLDEYLELGDLFESHPLSGVLSRFPRVSRNGRISSFRVFALSQRLAAATQSSGGVALARATATLQFRDATRISIRIGGKMQRKLTITVEAEVYEGLNRVIGRRRISRFLNDLARPHVLGEDLAAGYAAMAADEGREADAENWAEGLINDVADEPARRGR